MEVVYKLWESNWEDGAVLRDKASKVYTDPSKVHEIRYIGKHFQVPGIHLCEPSGEMEHFVRETGVDGFSVGQVVQPGTLRDFVDLVVPELQRRGLAQTEYAEGTYREKLFGEGPRLAQNHPGSLLDQAIVSSREGRA